MSFNMQTRNRNYVYTFTIVALASFFFMTAFILLNNNSLDKKIYLKTKISNALGIESHPPIIFKGFEIGRVDNFNFDESLDVSIDFYIYEKYAKLINSKSIIHPVRNPLTGIIIDFYVFSSNQGAVGLTNGSFVESSESNRGRVIVQSYGIKVKEPGVNEVVRRIDVLLREIDEQNIVNNMGFVAQRLKDTVHTIEGEVVKFQSEGRVEQTRVSISNIGNKMYDMFNNVNDLIGEFKGRNRSISSTVDKAENVLNNANYLLEGINQNEFVHSEFEPQTYSGEEGIEIND